jgi:hypothetical protein
VLLELTGSAVSSGELFGGGEVGGNEARRGPEAVARWSDWGGSSGNCRKLK